MLIDFQADSDHAAQFEVIDRGTGKPPTDAEGHEYGIWRADDVTGVFEYYVPEGFDAKGRLTGYKIDPEDESRPLSAMKVGRIKIRPRPPWDGPIPRNTQVSVYDLTATIIRDTPWDKQNPSRNVVYEVESNCVDDFADALMGIVKGRPKAGPHHYLRNHCLTCVGTSRVRGGERAYVVAIYGVPMWDVTNADTFKAFSNPLIPYTDCQIRSTTPKR